jgi:uncharacterized protein (TIGR00255 family)
LIKSMTGFGRGEYEDNGLQATVEIRSVNHRFREITVRMPRTYLQLEEKIKKMVEEKVVRGHLDIFVKIEDNREKKRNIKLDKELVLAYYNCFCSGWKASQWRRGTYCDSHRAKQDIKEKLRLTVTVTMRRENRPRVSPRLKGLWVLRKMFRNFYR